MLECTIKDKKFAAEVLIVIIQEYFWINWKRHLTLIRQYFPSTISKFPDIGDDWIFVLKSKIYLLVNTPLSHEVPCLRENTIL